MSLRAPVAAGRLKKPTWKDPRLLVGILLVLASVASVVALVDGADTTIEMYAAKDTIVIGQSIQAGSLERVRVNLGDVRGAYWATAEELPAGQVAVRLVPRGELLAKASVGSVDALDRKPAALSVEEALPKEAVVGSRVDVWISMPDARNGYVPPTLLLPGAEISDLTPGSTALGGTRMTTLHVLVTDRQMPLLLGALANKAKVAVVWNPAGGQQ
ncbi:hypothetical protein IV498_06190 [Paenarthrobacter sp. Z7-10]|uniref:hypothetical protein n=1 Tax=Paenarthrobacter sp. Z7-10 TaxID=2787635 RepID=UPI0022A951BF|nr:hypothetical protein [Paenarthrobacter sp. Z7-10]MCZ2402786.1 hypothetical protein [Paenarthrobacter sp. Z7-10]